MLKRIKPLLKKITIGITATAIAFSLAKNKLPLKLPETTQQQIIKIEKKMQLKRKKNPFQIKETKKNEFNRIKKRLQLYEKLLKENKSKKGITNVVFMGMGEPFHNYDNVISAIKILNDKDGFNLGVRHISISTCGIVPAIKKFADEDIQVNLAISLHAPNDEIRSKIMPVNKAYNLKKLFEAIDYYIKKTNRKVMFEYILIAGVNDSDENAKELAKIMQKKLYHINLIKYHDTGSFKSSSKRQQQRFFDILKKEGVSVTFRISFGEDISAACGQLAAKK